MSAIKNICYHLGCFDHCPYIVLPLKAKQDGVHKFRVKRFDSWHEIEFYGLSGKYFSIPNIANENSTHIAEIIEPDGTKYEYYDIEIEIGIVAEERPKNCVQCGYDCFAFETRIVYKQVCDPLSNPLIRSKNDVCYSGDISGISDCLTGDASIEYILLEGQTYTYDSSIDVDGIVYSIIEVGDTSNPPTLDTGSGAVALFAGQSFQWNKSNLTSKFEIVTNVGDKVALYVSSTA